MASSKRWTEVSTSPYEWEQDALSFIHERWPDRDPYRVWTNFEFIDHDGSINEVDLFAFSPRGAFLVEIKSWPERTEGDGGTWVRVYDNGSRRALDNPLLLANRKAKRLKGLIEEQLAKRGNSSKRVPFLVPLVFLSHPDVKAQLNGPGRTGVCLRDVADGSPAGGYPGIVAALTKITDEDKRRRNFRAWSTKEAELLAQALEGVGIRETSKHRRVGDWELGYLLEEGQGWQDFDATHVSVPDARRRIRIFGAGSIIDRELVTAAARREFRALEPIEHPGIVAPREYVEVDQGPALLYDREPDAVTLDHFLESSAATLTLERRLSIVRQISEAVAYAHSRELTHRGLSPRSVIVRDPDAEDLELRVRDWHVAHRSEAATTHTGIVTAHAHLLLEGSADVYLAPEHGRSRSGEHLDVFSLGATAFHVFTGKPPAESLVERQEQLNQHGGLDLAAVVDGARDCQRLWINEATNPDVSKRTATVRAFLEDLDEVEAELRAPEAGEEGDPTAAVKGESLAGCPVLHRLGRGGTAIAYLVDDQGEERVLKVAASREHNKRIRDEGEVIGKLDAPGIVKLFRSDVEVGGHAALLLEFAGSETLADRLRNEGPPGLELLERWGGDLLRAVVALEEQGVPHKDVKPDNIGVAKQRARESQLGLTLFDFSLSRSAPDAIEAGTPPYLDPFLRLPDRGRWDLSAERFALAVTLYEMATGQPPTWGDGDSDPAYLDVEATIEDDLFDPSVAKLLAAFLARALARQASDRFGSAEEMLDAWRACFAGTERTSTAVGVPADRDQALAAATPATRVADLPLSPRARSALRSAGIYTVTDLLATSAFDLRSFTGVGAATRDEILAVFRELQERLQLDEAPDVQSLDLLADQLVPSKGWANPADKAILETFLGLAGDPWLSSSELARCSDRSRGEVDRIIDRGRERWAKTLKSVTRLRDEIAEQLSSDGGFLPTPLLEEAIAVRRGAVAQGDQRQRIARAALRAAIEAESRRDSPRFTLARKGDLIVISSSDQLVPSDALSYIEELGNEAEALVGGQPIAADRAAEAFRRIDNPTGATLSAERLARLADAASETVATNARGELYPVEMPAEVALDWCAGVLAIGADLSIDEIRDRVRTRFPQAAEIPDRPGLDRLIEPLGLEWNPAISKYRPLDTALSTTRHSSRATTEIGAVPPDEFGELLSKSHQRFLALTARPRFATPAERRLAKERGVEHVHLDSALIRHMKDIAAENEAKWQAILRLDQEGPGGSRWGTLSNVAQTASERLRDELLGTPGTVLASRLGLLRRYGRLDMIDEIRGQLSTPISDRQLEGLWVLVPVDSKDQQPIVDGVPIPVIDENDWAHVPTEWIRA